MPHARVVVGSKSCSAPGVVFNSVLLGLLPTFVIVPYHRQQMTKLLVNTDFDFENFRNVTCIHHTNLRKARSNWRSISCSCRSMLRKIDESGDRGLQKQLRIEPSCAALVVRLRIPRFLIRCNMFSNVTGSVSAKKVCRHYINISGVSHLTWTNPKAVLRNNILLKFFKTDNYVTHLGAQPELVDGVSKIFFFRRRALITYQ